jgi:hypothetical protein
MFRGPACASVKPLRQVTLSAFYAKIAENPPHQKDATNARQRQPKANINPHFRIMIWWFLFKRKLSSCLSD